MGFSLETSIPVLTVFVQGLLSFFSPCVLPLLPGYLSYASGLSVTEVQEGGRRGRVLAGTALFVLGFAIVFVSQGALFGGLGSLLFTWSRAISIAIGIVAIALGLVFASSAATYGDGTSGFRDSEEAADLGTLAPLNPYGWSKLFVDRRIMADVEASAARPPASRSTDSIST